MKKHIFFFGGLVIVVILIALALTFNQVGWPSVFNSQTVTGFGGGLGESFSADSNLKIATADRAMAPSATAEILPRQVTKTGNLSILVTTAEDTAQNIQAIAESVAGYVSDTYLYEVTTGVKAGAITIRVPADKFDQTLSRIKELAIKVESENINANDVTDQFIDLEARLKNLEAQEDQYLGILKKATAVEDVLKVTNQLNQVRQQIDSWQGQLKYLNSQIDLSTITVNLTAEKEVQIFGLHWRPITVVKQAVRSLLNGLVHYANLIIAIIIFLPVIALWLITLLLIAWLIWWVVKKLKSKKLPLIQAPTKKKTKKLVAK
ncbi:MAG: DUF4349 domain-containing protein [Candidatus Paceibacterota bacterium]|jgi:hypothetical protein